MYFGENSSMKKKETTLIVKIKYFPLSKKKVNTKTKKMMNEHTILNIGSISKTITATAIMQLWEQQLIQLNEDINTYLNLDIRNPNHPTVPVTIHQLLTHSSSIQDGPSYDQSYQCGDPKISLKRRVKAEMFKLPTMMDCQTFDKFIVDYLDGNLTSWQKIKFKIHLLFCLLLHIFPFLLYVR